MSQSLEIMASDLAQAMSLFSSPKPCLTDLTHPRVQAFATKEEMPASIDEQIEKQRGRVGA